MKQKLKYKLSQLGLLPKLDFLRRLPEVSSWIAKGCTGIAPPPVKRLILSSYLRRFSIKQFVETGTHLGDTLAHIADDKAVKCTSIELADDYFSKATRRFASYPNVNLLHGDSELLLPVYVQELHEPVLFWLDGHYSGGTTGKGTADTPISIELAAILDSPIKNHIILIDDARCFTGANGYPCLDVLIKTVREQGNYDAEVSTDVIRLTPKG